MSKHTPGPWSIAEYRREVVFGPDDVLVASCCHAYKTRQECEANARLIAASAELLAACKELVGDIEAAYSTNMDDLQAEWPDLVETFDNAKAAIAKATGD
jgi:hypothetical protein